MKFKQSIKSIFVILLTLFVGVNYSFGQIPIDGIDPKNPATWFYVNLTAQPSTPACGANPGQVWLHSVTPSGEDSNPYVLPAKPVDPYNGEMNWQDGFDTGANDAKYGNPRQSPDYMYENNVGGTEQTERIEGYYAGYDWYKSGHYLNPENPVGFAATASLKGYTVVYAPGFEDLMGFSSYASFYGKAQENNGWYFTGWSFTDGDSDLGVGDENGTLFRILPSATAGEANIRNEYVYATFKPVMVSGYKVNGIINGSGNSTTVTFDVVGERVSASDFTRSVPEDNFSAEITSCENNKVTVSVTYNGSTNGEYRGNVTLASKSGCSQLTAAVYARVGGVSGEEASLYDTKVLETNLVKSDDLTKLLEEATTNQIIALNANYNKALTISKNVTIFTNGYSISSLNVTGGTVTFIYDKYNGGADAVSVTGGKLILNGGIFSTLTIGSNGTVEQNGATFTGVATNAGTLITAEGMFESGLTSTAGTLTINNGTFKGETAISVTGGTAIFNKAAISGTATGILVSGGETTISSKLVSVYGGTNAVKQTNGTVNLLNGKFDGATPLAGIINLQGGYFKTENPGVNVDDKKVLNVLAGTEFAEGYRYFIGDDATGIGVCRIGTTSYATLEAALAYANNNPTQDVVIIMTNDYTLPAGYYTLPARATLIVPMSDEQETGYEVVNRVSNNSAAPTSYVQPFEFRRLTFAEGVNMDVYGTIELTGTQRASDDGYAAMPHGAYGHLVMEAGSHMTLQNGSLLRAWGFMTGKGETDARRGSKVREQFQMGDWKGGSASFDMLDLSKNPGHVFPISQYFIQNVESPVKYHPGAILSTTTSVSANFGAMGITAMANDIVIVGVSGGDPAMFFMDQEADAENTWVRKWYDAEHDVQTYDVNSGAHIGSMVLDLGKLGTAPLKMNSGMFVLPITNNMKIHLLSGSMDFTQVTSLLPGAEVEVDKESTVTIYSNPDPEVFSGELIIYDKDQWGNYAQGKGDTDTKYTKVVKYSPSWDGALVAGKPANGKPTVRHEDDCPDDASINVHGTFATGDGYLLTTEGGANIFSSNEDAGTFICSQNPPSDEKLAGLYVLPINKNSAAKKLYLAKLKNADKSYTETAGAIQGLAFIYRDGAWQMPMIQTANDMIVTYNFNCFTADVSMMTYLNLVCNVTDYSSQQAMLASPMKEDVKNQVAIVHAPLRIKEYLLADAFAKANGFETGILPHEYEYFRTNYYAAVAALGKDKGEAAMISQMQNSGNPQQVAAANLVPLIPGFKTQAEEYDESYDFGTSVQKLYIKPQEWLEIAGTAHVQLNVDYGTIDEFEESYVNAIKAVQNNNYTACDDIVNEYLDYIESQRMNPAIVSVDGNADNTYSDADGAGRLFILTSGCQWWEVEKKDNLYHCIHPNNDTYYYWDDVEEDWKEQRFTITWKNWDGTIIQTGNADGDDDDEYSVTYGTMAEFLGTNPTRPEDVDYTYDFTGWSPELAPVTSDVTYTATYEKKERKYTIIFLQEGGVEIERQFLPHNAVPVCENTPTKIGHTLVWSPAIAAVTGDATYTATWEEEPPTKYEVTFYDYDGTTPLQQSDVNVGDMPTFNEATPTGKPATSEFTYVFDHWSPEPEVVSATSVKSYVAVYKEQKKTYPVKFYFEDTEHQIGETQNVEVGQTPVIPDDDRLKKTKDEGTIYTLIWNPNIETVLGNQAEYNYVASYKETPRQYALTLKCTPSGACTFTGAGTFDYNTTVNNVTVSYDEEQYEFQGWSDLTGDAKKATTHAAFKLTEDITIVADFRYKGDDKVTITWKNWNGSDLGTSEPKVNAATTFIGATPTREASESKTYTFYGWSTEANGGGTIYKNGLTPKATAPATYYAYFSESLNKYKVTLLSNNSDVCTLFGAGTYEYGTTAHIFAKVRDGYEFMEWAETETTNADLGNVKVQGDITYTAVVREAVKDKKVGIKSTYAVADGDIVKDLILESNGNASGQITNAAALTVEGNVYFDLSLNADAQTWYAFAVPWEVDATSGVSVLNGAKLELDRTYHVLYYDGANRAVHGKAKGSWKFLADTLDKTLEPGVFYLIYLNNSANTLRFTKKAGASIDTTSVKVQPYPSQTGNDADANWNGIANPAVYHAYMNAGVEYGQPYESGPIEMSSHEFIVGEPIFVQVPAEKTVIAVNGSYPAAAPSRWLVNSAEEPHQSFDIRIAAKDADYSDRLFVKTATDKADKYIIGQDLAKISVSKKAAQFWVDRYDAQLCVNTQAVDNDQAFFPLGIFAPTNGQYTISSATALANNEELFVTIDGTPVWNLGAGAYTIDLAAGNTTEYGLMVVYHPAPEVTTGCENIETNNNASVRKVLINGQVFILRDGAVYTIFGQKAK